MQKRKVIVAMSGGVDSSVAALMLQKKGYEVTGLFMKNWDHTLGLSSQNCPYEEDILYTKLVCEKLGIKLYSVDLTKEYKKRVVDYMYAEYRNGKTPNPDILCNREIKFDVFLKEAFKYKVDFVSTGHYCRVKNDGKDSISQLFAGVDKYKDQSYFLCQLEQHQLKKIFFPLGNYTKEKVREIALRYNLPSAKRKDSQGICFIGKVYLPTFLKQQLPPKEGQIIEIDKNTKLPPLDKDSFHYSFNPSMGKKIGHHDGVFYYTLGQRKGIKIGGKKLPLYVLHISVKNNILYVGEGDDHPLLYRKKLIVKNSDIHWIRPSLKAQIGEKRNYLVRIRYRQKLQKASLIFEAYRLVIQFDTPQRAITPGQFAAWYDDEELIGSGKIA